MRTHAEMITVTAYTAPSDARVAKGALDGVGIESVIDEQLARAKVRVHNVDAIRAGDVITAHCPTLAEIDEADEDELLPECHMCGSEEIVKNPRAQTFALVAVTTLGVGFGADLMQAAFFAVAASGLWLLIRGRWRCNLCGETWN